MILYGINVVMVLYDIMLLCYYMTISYVTVYA